MLSVVVFLSQNQAWLFSLFYAVVFSVHLQCSSCKCQREICVLPLKQRKLELGRLEDLIPIQSGKVCRASLGPYQQSCGGTRLLQNPLLKTAKTHERFGSIQVEQAPQPVMTRPGLLKLLKLYQNRHNPALFSNSFQVLKCAIELFLSQLRGEHNSYVKDYQITIIACSQFIKGPSYHLVKIHN